MENNVMYIDEIKKVLPHRYPFLMVDRVVDIVAGQSGVGIKNVTVNEEFFNGHFPTTPTMPGVLMLEAMCQTAVLVGSTSNSDDKKGEIVLLTGIDNAKFKNRVIPGDQLHIHVKKVAERGSFEKWQAEIYVDDKLCVSALLSAMKTGKQSI
ncbi:MAG: 3-hydroxyacyl-ACP dehydratase FabZ [Alphaproteobacteria bacterium]|nr:3-hydroxyacyl-ACP dehydratase FabZ [Alphaproteobacteria bacterium]